MNLPLSVYDFFGYLATGFILLATADYAFQGGWLLKDSIPITYVVVYGVLAYIFGHLIANVSSYLLEHKFLRGILKSPEETLFAETKPEGVWPKSFPVFYKPFPPETRKRVLDRAKTAGIETPGRGLFFHCLPIVMRESHVLARLNTFLNMYGFCRNTSLTALLTIPIMIVGMFRHFRWAMVGWVLVALCVAVGMFYRYLKFFKHYTEEVFRTYAEMPDKDKPKDA